MWDYTEDLDVNSILKKDRPTLIFKHSNRCSISSMALSRISSSKSELDDIFDIYLIDVVKNRLLSLNIARDTGIQHESPQAIVINQGKVVYSASHMNIETQSLLSNV
ncbi:MAG: bacillithiol system redox-active protein YtxJ [Bacteroidia bacterium]|nr:bacillithiol system redox-active protein YtxJ [Bacteroidia bacterium]NNJ56843.1 bacillithiol system redox-active protein YtxJ [Bacteroidia bacterium]